MNLKDNTFIRFGIVGIINTIVGMSVMFLLFNLAGCSYWLSSAANYVVGSIVSYFLNRNFTFHSKEKQGRAVVKFIVNIVVCYLIAYGFAKPLALHLMSGYDAQLQGNVALLAGSILFVILNYFGQKFFVFSSKANLMGEKRS